MILAPLVALEPEEFVGDRAEALAEYVILLEVAQRLGEALGERADAVAGHGLEVGGVEVAEVGLAGVELAGEAVEARGQVRGQAQVRIERAGDRAVLDVAAL